MKKIIYLITAIIMLSVSALMLQPSKVDQAHIDYDKYEGMLEYFSKEERSLGSPYHTLMREYLIEELESRGLEVVIVESTESDVVLTAEGEEVDFEVVNIYATLKATNPNENTSNIVFASHYDSVAGSYGAADAGLPVISFFAGLDSIINEERVNDISILITDHEELGLVGARFFVESRPDLVEGIDYLYNWESRGTGGNVILFETSDNDYEGVRHYIDAVDQNFAASFATAVYSRMPNGSDFTMFRNAGIEGLNFAMIEQFAHYHTSLDHIDNIPDETFNYYVNNVEQVMRNSATNEFNIKSNQRSVYFNYLDTTFIFSDLIVYILMAVSILLFGYIVYFELKSKFFNKRQLALSIGLVIAVFIIANITSLIPVSILDRFSEYKPPQLNAAKVRFTLIYNDVYAIAMYLINAVTLFGLTYLFGKKNWINKNSMFIVMLSVFVILMVAVNFILFGALPIFIVPILVYEVVYILNKQLNTTWFNMLLLTVLIPILLPIAYYIYIALTINAYVVFINIATLMTLLFGYLILEKKKDA